MRLSFSNRFLIATAYVVTCLMSWTAAAQVSTSITYEDHIKRSRNFAALGDDLFGEKINLQDGAVSFSYEDASIPTQSGLRVAVGRKSAERLLTNTPQFHVFGQNWDLDVPYMMATYDSRDGWNAGNSVESNGGGTQPPNYNRCSAGYLRPRERLGPWPYYYSQTIYAHMYWKGIQINIPGYGQEQMLKLNAGQTLPTSGGPFYATTKSAWKVGCLPTIQNGAGEGFTVKLKDGVTYYFDWMATRKAVDLTDDRVTDAQGNGIDPWHLLAPLTDVYLFATKAVDRFGNIVTYSYDPSNPQRLTSIVSNDGARLDIQYNADGRISSVTSGSRIWTYAYSGNVLTSLQLPDGAKWEYSGNFSKLSSAEVEKSFWSNACEMDQGKMNASQPADPATLSTISIIHPSGAHGEFIIRPIYHGINNAPGGCGLFGSQETSLWYGTWGVPSVYGTNSLYSRRIYGPGMSDRTWSYSYAPTWSFQSQCGSGCSNSVTTTITDNEGVKQKYTFGNDYQSNYGQLLSMRREKAGVVLKAVDNTYLSTATGQSFPDNMGDIPTASGDVNLYGNPFKVKNRPLSVAVTQQDGATYTKTISAFDLFARPTTIVDSNSLGTARAVTTEYHDDLSLWVLGQVKKRYTANTNLNNDTSALGAVVSEETTFNAAALPWKLYRFGKLQQTLTYNANGTLSTAADGGENNTTFSNWTRGIPQLITYADGKTQSATVDATTGWITSVTDENGYVTGYGYDAMGRMASIVQPTGDTLTGGATAYHSTWANYRALTDTDWKPTGVSTGQWRKLEGTGDHIAVTYYDALWRPVLTNEYDQNNVASTLRAVRTEYDSSGRKSFESYPASVNVPGSTGIRTFYDALDRVTRVEQDSELGVLETNTEYLAGLKMRVTNPRGQKTTTTFMAWDQPSYDLPTLSEQPEGKVIQIARHPQFGWPLSMTQRNAANTLSQTRRYVYDGNAQLCKTIEPETGATVTGYDAAGNPSWSAAGLDATAYGSTTDCQHAAAYASGRASNRTYDTRNRLSQLSFPDGRGNQIWTYEPDGKPASVTAYNGPGNTLPVVMAYTYNHRRLLTGESVSQTGSYTWTIGSAYDAYGNLASQTYPTGLTVNYAPNPLGQATKAGIYATGAQYYPNGALKQFTYGNGIVHSMTQNLRQLPARVTSNGGVTDFGYTYDASANIAAIADHARGSGYDRTMSYDGLDRLLTTASPMFGGTDQTHRYTYDALDNLKSWKLAGVKDYADYVYDAQNRLTNIRNTANATVVGLGYDLQGNVVNKNGQGYDFDYGNRLRTVTNKESYRYDGLGRRVQTSATDGSKTTLWQYTQAGQMLFSSDWDGATYANQKTHENVYLAGSIVATIDHDWPSNAVIATKYQHTDALGSPVAVTNAAGTVTERNDYEPYGAVIGKPTYSGIGYTGHVMDGGTGLTYMQQRYYDPIIGRFMSVDPVSANRMNGVGFNRYLYANANPYHYVDPDGRLGELYDKAKYKEKNDREAALSNSQQKQEGASGPFGVGQMIYVDKNTVSKATSDWADPTQVEQTIMAIAQDMVELRTLSFLGVKDLPAAGAAAISGLKSFISMQVRTRITTVQIRPWIGTYETNFFGVVTRVDFQGLGNPRDAIIQLERQSRMMYGSHEVYRSDWENQPFFDNTQWLQRTGLPLHDVP